MHVSALGIMLTPGMELLLFTTVVVVAVVVVFPVDFWRVPRNSSLIPRENDLVLVLDGVSVIVTSVSGDSGASACC